MSCALCNILINERERVIVRATNAFLALNIEPIKPAHLMVMPSRHVKDLSDLTAEEAKSFLDLCEKGQDLLGKVYPHEFPIIGFNCWAKRTQEHLHAHLVCSKYGIRGLFSRAEHLPEERNRVTLDDLIPYVDKLRVKP